MNRLRSFIRGKNGIARVGIVALLLGGLWLGLRYQDLVLVWASLFALATLSWGGVTVVLTRLVLARAISASTHPGRIDGSSDEEDLTGWHWRLPAWLPLADFSSDLNGYPTRFTRLGGRMSEVACFPRRRLQDGLIRNFQVTDFLGVSTWSFQDHRSSVLRILPTVDSGQGVAPLISVVSGADLPDPYSAETGDRLDMRRYRRGDPLRLVLWSIYQRSGHVMVRAPEKAVSQHQRTGLYLLTNPRDRPAAKLARVLLEKDALGPNWRFGADGTRPWANHKDQALNVLADSGTPDSPVRIHSFLQDLARDRFGKCLILVTDDLENRNHKLALLAHGQRLPRLSLEIWVVFDRPNVPARNTFPTVAGSEMHLIERRGAGFKMVPW